MKMKQILPMMMIAATPVTGMAQRSVKSGIDATDLNTSVKAGDNFLSVRLWRLDEKNPLPGAYSCFGSFDRLGQDNNKRINSILNELKKGTFAKGP